MDRLHNREEQERTPSSKSNVLSSTGHSSLSKIMIFIKTWSLTDSDKSNDAHYQDSSHTDSYESRTVVVTLGWSFAWCTEELRVIQSIRTAGPDSTQVNNEHHRGAKRRLEE